MGQRQNGEKTLLQWALEYRRAGINVVKAYYKGKCPPKDGEWECYRTLSVPEGKLYEWWGPGTSYSNISGVTGPISEGLTGIDFDVDRLYGAWANRHPDLARTLPTSKSGKGYHVYGRSVLTADDTNTYAGIDIKAGGLVSLPPSMHKRGVRYRWIIPLPAHVSELPLLDPYALGLDQLTDGTDGTDGTEGTDGKEGRCEGCGVLSLEGLPAKDRGKIEQAIEKTLPTGYGQRYALLFLLARMLKAIEAIKDRSADKIMFIVNEWHRRALPNIEHKSLTMTQERFRNAWRDAKYPPGDGESLKIAFENAKRADYPMPELEPFADDETMTLMVRLCFELQRLAGPGGEWFVPTHKGPELFGVSHAWVATLLDTLEGRRIIRKTQSHTARRCRRYVYTGPSIDRPQPV
jgi:hypothetical protein